MTMLYSKEDYLKTVSLLRRIWLIILALVAVCILVWVILAANQDKETRIQWPGYVSAGVCAAAVVFIYGYFGSRVNAYRRFLRDVDQGLEREALGSVLSIDEKPSVSENLEYLIIHLDADAEPGHAQGGERLLRYDPAKGQTPFAPGQKVRFLLFGNNIKGYEILS